MIPAINDMTILMVDDTPDNIRILNELLSGFNRKVATNGEKALKIATSGSLPDLILLDINMPGMSGLEVCEKLKADPATSDIPIIFLTAQSDKETTIQGFKLGANDYITKPFDADELLVRVRTQLKLKIQRNIIEFEKEKSENLLLNILPEEIASELKEKGTVSPQYFQSATVLFADIVGFTKFSKGMAPDQMIGELNLIFHGIDEIVTRHNLEKIKMIGDGYLAVGGVPVKNDTHPKDAVMAGLEMIKYVSNLSKNNKLSNDWKLRIGINTGDLVAGVIGNKKFAFDIWGETVNKASRMESAADSGTVNISEATYKLVKDEFDCKSRGKVPVKNMGELEMFLVKGKL
ncbi:MAG: adenylate/guanylate cyclase domain-containing protein [Bacteroidota bacterium]